MTVFSGQMSRDSEIPLPLLHTFPAHFDLVGSSVVNHILITILGYNVPELFLFSFLLCYLRLFFPAHVFSGSCDCRVLS
jgi:hypothetical protein